jgi:MerR family transcriptional regulator, light-induced transcriptional regulator
MYTIGEASRLTGVSEAVLRAWERRYAVVVPRRTEAGYRIYDEAAVSSVTAMRSLVDAGWSPSEAARALRTGTAPAVPTSAAPLSAGAATWRRRFLAAAAALDTAGMEQSLDGGFALGSFEHVVESWLFPTLQALGEGWAKGDIDVAGEHAASHAVHRRLSAAFEAAGSRSRGPSVVVGLPPASLHELGALAFATTLRRVGHDVLYLGSDVPLASWQVAVERHQARAAVVVVVSPGDRDAAAAVSARLLDHDRDLVVATGGASGDDVADGVRSLPAKVTDAAAQLDRLLHGEPTR